MPDCMEINKDEVIKRLRDMTKAYAATGNHNLATLFRDAADLIEQKSALYERALSDVVWLSVERKHGAWISIMGHSVCNVCGYKGSPIVTNFCPNCGARMVTGDDN